MHCTTVREFNGFGTCGGKVEAISRRSMSFFFTFCALQLLVMFLYENSDICAIRIESVNMGILESYIAGS